MESTNTTLIDAIQQNKSLVQPSRSPAIHQEQSFCKFFDSGNCTKGDTCQFRHRDKCRYGTIENCNSSNSRKTCFFLHYDTNGQVQHNNLKISNRLSTPLRARVSAPQQKQSATVKVPKKSKKEISQSELDEMITTIHGLINKTSDTSAQALLLQVIPLFYTEFDIKP